MIDALENLVPNMAVVCQGGDRTCLEPVVAPKPGPGELLLKLRAVGLCGTDLFKLDTGAATAGTVLGHELVGQVIDQGVGAETFVRGDRIAVPHHVPCGSCVYCVRGNDTMCETFRVNLMEPGGFADTILIKERAVASVAFQVPDDVPDEAAVFVEPAACVLRGVERSGIGENGIAVIQGGGSMGLLHLLVLKAAVKNVRTLVIDPVASRRTLAINLGADAAAAPGADALQTIKKVSDGHGADVVFDTVGGAALLNAALALSRQGGSIVLFAHAPEGERANFDLNDLFKYERRIIGTYSGAVGEQHRVFDLMTSGKLDPTPLVTHRFPLDDFQRGIDLVKRHEALKVLYTPSRAAEQLTHESACD